MSVGDCENASPSDPLETEGGDWPAAEVSEADLVLAPDEPARLRPADDPLFTLGETIQSTAAEEARLTLSVNAPRPLLGGQALDVLNGLAKAPVALTGEQGLLTALVAGVLQQGLEVELARHLGHGRWEWASRGADNIRNGAYRKRVLTDLGVVGVQMPRDRRGTFDPVIVPKHGRRLPSPTTGVAAVYASGMSRGEMRGVIDAATGSQLDAATLDGYLDELEPRISAAERRRFHSTCTVLLIDSITLLGRGKRAGRRVLNVAIAVDAYGGAELLGLWRHHLRAGGAARYTPMLDELRYRGISAVECIAGSGDSDLITAARLVWPQAEVQPGVAQLVENALRAVS